MNITLFKTTFKKNFFLLVIFVTVLSLYASIIISMFDPNQGDALTAMLNSLPKEFISAFSMNIIPSDLTGFVASLYYGFLVFMFPMVYCIILGNRLVAKLVDNGSFAYLLSTPNSRSKIIITQGIYLLSSILFMFICVFFVGTIVSTMLFTDLLDLKKFLLINVSACLLTMVVGMICFFFSCVFNDTKKSLSFGGGIPIGFMLLYMIGGASEKTEIFKKLSLYNLLDAPGVASGSSNLLVNIFFLFLILSLFVGSVVIFNKKRLPL